MDVKTIIGSLVNIRNLEDRQVLRIWYTAKMIVDKQKIDESDDIIFNLDLELEKVKIIAALDLYDLLASLPLMVSNIAKFKKLTMGIWNYIEIIF